MKYIATERLKKLIAEKNWRQKDFAVMACLSRPQACAIINQRKNVTPLVRERILAIFPEERFNTLFLKVIVA